MIYTKQDILMHHGVKGQQWGVKNGPPYPIKYWNKDRTPTEAGKRRKHQLSEIAKKESNKMDISHPSKIRKGDAIYRVANEGETLDNKRKYVSFKRDVKTYIDFAKSGDISTDASRSFGLYTYKAVKDLKVADYDMVHNYIVNKYGNVKVKEVSKLLATDHEGWALYNKLSERDRQLYQNEFHIWAGLAKDIEKKHLSEITEHFIKEGYDIMSDFFDSPGIPTAMIVLNPRNSLAFVNYKEYGKPR